MLDDISIERLSQGHPVLSHRIQKLDAMVEPDGFSFRVTCVLRSWSQQDAEFAKGRTVPGVPCTHNGVTRPVRTCQNHPFGLVVTNAKGGYSMHNFGFAADIVPADPNFPTFHPDWNTLHPSWQDILKKALTCGLAEGAQWRTFPDAPHLYLQELPADPTDEMRQTFKDAGMTTVWHEARIV